MTPILFAAALAVSPAPSQPYFNLQPGRHRLDAPIRDFVQPPAACARLETQTVAPDGVRIFKKLNELPWGVMEHAVWRTVSGCPVREIVFGGQTYYVASASPRVERLDPVAHQPLEKRFGF
jgi:hypothetical protein